MIPLIEAVRVGAGYQGWSVRLAFGSYRALAVQPTSESEALCVAAFLTESPRVAWAVLRAHVGATA